MVSPICEWHLISDAICWQVSVGTFRIVPKSRKPTGANSLALSRWFVKNTVLSESSLTPATQSQWNILDHTRLLESEKAWFKTCIVILDVPCALITSNFKNLSEQSHSFQFPTVHVMLPIDPSSQCSNQLPAAKCGHFEFRYTYKIVKICKVHITLLQQFVPKRHLGDLLRDYLDTRETTSPQYPWHEDNRTV